jgi:transcriptional regulator with XRE-family HTH domain
MKNWAREYIRRRNDKDSDFRTALEKGAPALAAAKAVRQLRADLDVTQRRLADLTGIPQPHIARIERARGASLRSLYRLASALGLEIELRFVGVEQGDAEATDERLAPPTNIARLDLGRQTPITPTRRIRVNRPLFRIERDGTLDLPA